LQTKKSMKHLKKIVIANFWNKGNIIWELQPDVNVLVGINGSGKTAILTMIKEALSPKDTSELNSNLFFGNNRGDGMELVFSDKEFIKIDKNNIREFSIDASMRAMLTENPVDLVATFYPPNNKKKKLYRNEETTLDENLEYYLGLFDTYKKEIDIEIIAAMRGSINEQDISNLVKNAYKEITELYKLIDVFFEETGKSINNEKEPFYFLPIDISYTALSSGEKQLLILFLATFMLRKKESILLLDEPEISLHATWQRKLISTLRQINPLCQLIIVTHSASLYANDWLEHRKVMEMEGEDSIWEQTQETTNPQIVEPQQINNENLPAKSEIINEELLKDLIVKIEDARNPFDKTLAVNLRLKEEQILNFVTCEKFLQIMKFKTVRPDQITLGTIMGRIDSFENGNKVLEYLKKEKIIKFNANAIALNQLLKKENDLDIALEFVKDKKDDAIGFPDIITFSTLLGKVRTAEPAKKIEELRNSLGVIANEQYIAKLNSLLRQV
jgi:ABC-type molybdenum transport system ATPase subunit/photorepair protein PhrA